MNAAVPAAALLVLAPLASCGWSAKTSGPDKTETHTYQVTQAVRSLHVTTEPGDIQITGTDRSTVQVTEKWSYRGHKPTSTHPVRDDQLTLSYAGCRDCGVDYTIELPKTTSIVARTAAGDVTLAAITAKIDAKTDAGDVIANDVGPPELRARTGAGDITATLSTPPSIADATSDAGKITLHLPKGRFDVQATTDTGDRTVQVDHDPASPNKIKAHSAAGDVEIRH